MRIRAVVPLLLALAAQACASPADDEGDDDDDDDDGGCGGGWVTASIGAAAVDSRFALAADGTDTFALFADAATSEPMWAARVDDVWVAEAIAPAAGARIVGQPALSARDGVIHAAWTAEDAGGELRTVAATRENDAWTLDTVDEDGTGHVALALDDEGADHVVYDASGEVREAVRSGDIWTTEAVDGADPGGGAIGLAIDGSFAALLYATGDGDVYGYGREGQGTWDARLIDNGAWVTVSRGRSTQGLVFARIDDTGDVTINQVSEAGITRSDPVGAPSGPGSDTSLGVDVLSDGTIVIAHRLDDRLVVASRPPSRLDFRRVTAHDTTAGAHLSLVVDAADVIHVAHETADGLQHTYGCVEP